MLVRGFSGFSELEKAQLHKQYKRNANASEEIKSSNAKKEALNNDKHHHERRP